MTILQRLLAAGVLMATCALASTARAAEVIDRVLAVASGHLIMASDVEAARSLGFVTTGNVDDPVRAALTALIDRALMLAEVDRYVPPEPDEAAIERELGLVRARFANAQAFAAVLNRVGMTESSVRERIRQDLRIAAYLDQRFTVLPPSDEEIDALYLEESESFQRAGKPLSLEEARPLIVRTWTDRRRAARVTEWIAGLRRRSSVTDLYSAR